MALARLFVPLALGLSILSAFVAAGMLDEGPEATAHGGNWAAGLAFWGILIAAIPLVLALPGAFLGSRLAILIPAFIHLAMTVRHWEILPGFVIFLQAAALFLVFAASLTG